VSVGAISDLCQSVVICVICVFDALTRNSNSQLELPQGGHHSSAIIHQALKSESFHGIEWLWGVVVS